MKYPKMIMFDYGDTLLYEPDWSIGRGARALMEYITKNPCRHTLEEITAEVQSVFDEMVQVRRTARYDIPCMTGFRLAFGRLGIELSLSSTEMEKVFWTAATQGAVTPHAAEMLDALTKRDIPTAVISNNAWSSDALRDRFDRLLPNHRFVFVLSSCDFMVRKPDKRFFEIALARTGLAAEDVWYCGNSIRSDVFGAHGAGMFPVLYEGDYPHKTYPAGSPREMGVDFAHGHIRDWMELIETLDGISR